MILTFHPRYLNYFNSLLYPPLRSAVEEILNKIHRWNLFKKCMSRYFSLKLTWFSLLVLVLCQVFSWFFINYGKPWKNFTQHQTIKISEHQRQAIITIPVATANVQSKSKQIWGELVYLIYKRLIYKFLILCYHSISSLRKVPINTT